MITNFEKLSEIHPDHLWFQFSSDVQDIAWSEAQQYSNQVSRWTAYLNVLALNSLLPYLRENVNLDSSSLAIMFSDRLSQSQIEISYLWECFNGTAIQIGDIRLVVIPDDGAIADELHIVKEWVDIPQFAADYYLGVQVDVEEKWVRVWGYTTHQQIKEKAEYDNWDRMYLLDGDDAIADLNILWMARELEIQERGEFELTTLPSLTGSKKNDLIEKWGKPSAYSPRLEVTDEEFSFWGALLWDNSGREELYQKRTLLETVHEKTAMLLESQISDVTNNQERTIEKVLQEIFNTFDSGWQTVESMLDFSDKNFAFRNKTLNIQNRDSLEDSEKGFLRAKFIDLDLKTISEKIILLVGFMEGNESQEIDVTVEIRPMDDENDLPPHLELMILNNNEIPEIYAHANEESPRISFEFSVKIGEPFSVKLVLGDFDYIQRFLM